MIILRFASFSLVISGLLMAPVQAVEPIYPDQLRLFSLGKETCGDNYRPVTRDEAQSIRSSIVNMMGKWQISGLASNWVIMGSGYNGEIKKGASSTTWCYPTSPVSDEIPVLSSFDIPAGDEIDVQWKLVHDIDYLIKPVSYLAHNLGYAWVGGNHGQYVGEDMDVTQISDGWLIQGNNHGSCSGYRCDEKSSIKVDKFSYTVDPGSFHHGQATENDKELIQTISATAVNHSNIEQQVVINLKYDSQSNWSKTDTYTLSEKVTTKNSFKWPYVGDTELAIEIASGQSWASQKGGATTNSVTVEARPMVPPNSSLPVSISLYKSSIAYPYEFKAEVNYDLTMKGFLAAGGNAWHSHPGDRPTMAHTFAIGPFRDKASNIRYQWDKRYIPAEVKWWDWNWAIREHGMDKMISRLSKVLRPIRAGLIGDFYAENQFAGDIEIGLPQTKTKYIKVRNTSEGVELIDVKLDKVSLAKEGFGDVTLTIAPVQ